MRRLAVALGVAGVLAAFPAFAWAVFVTGEEAALGALGQTVTFALVLAAAGTALAGLLAALGDDVRAAWPLLLVALALYLAVGVVPLALAE